MMCKYDVHQSSTIYVTIAANGQFIVLSEIEIENKGRSIDDRYEYLKYDTKYEYCIRW
jgi:hypothetical protein